MPAAVPSSLRIRGPAVNPPSIPNSFRQEELRWACLPGALPIASPKRPIRGIGEPAISQAVAGAIRNGRVPALLLRPIRQRLSRRADAQPHRRRLGDDL